METYKRVGEDQGVLKAAGLYPRVVMVYLHSTSKRGPRTLRPGLWQGLVDRNQHRTAPPALGGQSVYSVHNF